MFTIPSCRLDEKICIVTGASPGSIGYGLALALAQAGAHIVVTSRTLAKAEETAAAIKSIGQKALPLAIDVNRIDDIERMIAATVDNFGRLDVMVNNAGVLIRKPILEMTEEDWDYVIDTNLKSVFFCSQAAARQMIAQGEGGRIIQIASNGGLMGVRRQSAYAASKAGVISLTRTMALEWARYGILVNAIAPGNIMTRMNEEFLADPRMMEATLKITPLRRIGSIEDLGALVVFLASPASSYMTGSTVVIDGGILAGR